MNESTIYKYRLLLKQIGNFAKERGLRYLKELNLPMLDDFRSEWKDGPHSALKKLERLRAFVLLLRYSGLRIGDAVGLSTDRVQENRLFLYTQKTGVRVYCVLNAILLQRRSSLRPAQASSISSGPADRRPTARKGSGSDAFSGCSSWQRSRKATLTGFATRLRWNSCFRAYHWSKSRFCLAIPACALLNATTRHGYGRGKSSLKRICKVRGAKTRLR